MAARALLIVAGALTIATIGTACSGSNPDARTLRIVGDARLWATLPRTHAHRSYTVMMQTLCTTGDPVRILRVTALNPTGGAKISSWGVRRHFPDDGYARSVPLYGPVSRMEGFGHHPVTVHCGDRRDADEFAVSVQRSAPARGTITGVTISYGRQDEAAVPYQVVMCRRSNRCS